MAQTLASLPNGALVKDNGSLYNGVPVIFRKAATNHTGYPANSVTLITERIISIKPNDAREPTNADANRASSGNNRYRTSNIRQWLNSAANPPWFTAQNLTDGVANTNNRDQTPNAANVHATHGNAYDTERGFLANFSANFRNAMLATNLGVARNTVTDGGGHETVSDLFFNASNTEVGLANENNIAEGTRLPIFSDNNSRLAFQTQQAINASQATTTAIGNAWHWWLRTPLAANSLNVRLVHSSGDLSASNAWNGSIGLRPLCNLQSGILVSDTPDPVDGAFVMLFVQPPTMPPTLDVPSTILGGTNPVIEWGLSTDQNTPPQAITYVLERSTNGGAWTEIFAGIARTFTDSVAAGLNTVQYRVRARNTSGQNSANNTSSVINVITNTPPSISGDDVYLGEETGAFTFNYSVTDPDPDDIITVTERLNGALLREFVAQNGAAQTVEVTADLFVRLPNAPTTSPHTITIIATDRWGASDTRTLTFSKNETQIDITKADPHPANARPSRAIITVERQIPTGATFQVLICNNAFDASPAWEDCTGSVLAGGIFSFTNETLTAENWGVSVRVLVNRNNAIGDCFIASIGGNFE